MVSYTFTVGLLAMLVPRTMASCAYGTLLHPRAEAGGSVEVKNFGYTGGKGPTNWVALDPTANAVCATGKNQSPIDMIAGSFSMIPAAQLSLKIPDMTEGTEFENLGTTVEVVAGNGSMSFAGVNYTLKQFHFHLPSEHLDNGTSMAMEMHMVWQSDAGEVAVIGAFIDVADAAAAGGAPIAQPGLPSNKTVASASINLRDSARAKFSRRQVVKEQAKDKRQLPGLSGGFFHVNAPSTSATSASSLLETVLGSVDAIATPGTVTKTEPLIMSELVNTLTAGSFQTYEGSLTTPPCNEGVRWLVSDQKLTIQTSTFFKARNVIGFNSRFPQGAPGEENVLALAAKAGKATSI